LTATRCRSGELNGSDRISLEVATAAQDDSKPLFIPGVSVGLRVAVLAALAVVLMTLDHRGRLGDSLTERLIDLSYPLHALISAPINVGHWVLEQARGRGRLLAENEQLRRQALLNEARLQRLDQLERENIRLQRLLDSSQEVDAGVLIAQLLHVDLDPYRHVLQIRRGSIDGVFAGQTVIDAQGVMGQVDRVGRLSARVRLITDPSHSIPVEVNRNGLRAVAYGVGRLDEIDLRHLPNNADIHAGDLLVTSGLGGGFIAGYPVARVSHVERRADQPFAVIKARPLAALNRSRELLLVRERNAPVPDDADSPEDAGEGPLE
jgi:rod shape-determining protein MreC